MLGTVTQMFMRLKKETLLVWLLALFSSAAAWSGEFDRGILWQVSKPGLQASYVLGTIHSEEPEILNLPGEVKRALEKSTSFTAELDMGSISIFSASMQMMLPGDKNLKDIVGSQRYQQCVRLMSDYGMPEMMVAKLKPWVVATHLSMPKPKTGVFLDLKLFQMAQAQGKKTYGLETMDEQMGVFEHMTQEQQLAYLDQAIKSYPEMPGMIHTLIRYYRNRDLRGMKEFSEREMKKVGSQLSDLIQDKLIVERNERMVERMQPQLVEGRAFIAVGSLHLPGDMGILNLLKKRGYSVTAIY